MGRPEEALPLAEEAVAIARALGDRGAEAHALNSLSIAQANAGQLEQGLASVTRALELALEIGSADTPRCYVNAASLEWESGRLVTAARLHADGLALAQRLDNTAFTDWLATRGRARCRRPGELGRGGAHRSRVSGGQR